MIEENTAWYQYFIRPVSSYCPKTLNPQVHLGKPVRMPDLCLNDSEF